MEAQANSAIEGIVTSVDEMLKRTGRLHDASLDTGDALLHHEAILDAYQRLGAETCRRHDGDQGLLDDGPTACRSGGDAER